MTSSPEGRQEAAVLDAKALEAAETAYGKLIDGAKSIEAYDKITDAQRCETIIVAYLSALPAPVAAAPVGVKALEWKDGDAKTGLGSAYTTHQQADGLFAAIGCGSFVGGTHPTREAAKSAAQADYEARIRFALITPAKPAVAPTRWLVSSTPLPGSTCELVEAGQLSGDEPCECGECTVDECADCCSPADNYPKDREAADALAAKDTALSDRKLTNLIPVMKPGEYQHFGMEFWSEHKAFGDPEYSDDFERSLLIAYVNHLRTSFKSGDAE